MCAKCGKASDPHVFQQQPFFFVDFNLTSRVFLAATFAGATGAAAGEAAAVVGAAAGMVEGWCW